MGPRWWSVSWLAGGRWVVCSSVMAVVPLRWSDEGSGAGRGTRRARHRWQDRSVLPVVRIAEMQAVDAEAPEPVEVLVDRSEEHTSELQSLMRISYAVFCLKKKKKSRTATK